MSTTIEWCEHDDEILHPEVDGKKLNVHLKRAGRYVQLPAVMAWVKDHPVSILGVTDSGDVSILIEAPDFAWRAEFFSKPAGWTTVEPPDTIYPANENHIFTLRRAA